MRSINPYEEKLTKILGTAMVVSEQPRFVSETSSRISQGFPEFHYIWLSSSQIGAIGNYRQNHDTLPLGVSYCPKRELDIILYHSWSIWVSTAYQNSSLSDSHLTRLNFMSKRAENYHLQSSMAFWHGNPDDTISFCYTWTPFFYIPSAQWCCLPKLSSKGTLKRMPSYFLLQQK